MWPIALLDFEQNTDIDHLATSDNFSSVSIFGTKFFCMKGKIVQDIFLFIIHQRTYEISYCFLWPTHLRYENFFRCYGKVIFFPVRLKQMYIHCRKKMNGFRKKNSARTFLPKSFGDHMLYFGVKSPGSLINLCIINPFFVIQVTAIFRHKSPKRKPLTFLRDDESQFQVKFRVIVFRVICRTR